MAGSVICVLGMETFHSGAGASDSPARARPFVTFWHQIVPLLGITLHGRGVSPRRVAIAGKPCLGRPHSACSLEAADAPDGQGTTQPVRGRKRGPVVEKWRHFHHDRHVEMTTHGNVDGRTGRSIELGGYDVPVIHPERDRGP